MANTWDRIPQTHRTILFEQFTHPNDAFASNLYDLLVASDDENLDQQITKKLEVHSFKEFIGKFLPKVYEYVEPGTGNRDFVFHYTTDPKKAEEYSDYRELKLTQEAYYEMLVNMYTQKGDSGLANIDFNDEKIREILSPKSEMEYFYDTRRQLPLLLEQYEECIKRHENPASIIKKINKLRREAIQKSKNLSSGIAIKHDDNQRKMEIIDDALKQSKNSQSNDADNTPLLQSGRPDWDENGKLIFIPAKSSASDDPKNDSPSDPQSDPLEKFSKTMEDDLKKYAPDSSNYARALVVSAYTGRDIQAAKPSNQMNLAELVEYREDLEKDQIFLENLYKQMKEALIEALSDVVQKILSVKIFFDHATVQGTESDSLPKAGLIIANCKASKLVGSRVKDKFAERMKHYGKKESRDKKIWFAILPDVDDTVVYDDVNDELQEPFGDPYGGTYEKAPDKKVSSDKVDFNAAKSLLKIMDESNITTVFNFTPTEEMTFSGINVNTIKNIKDTFSEINNEHAVYAMPNFTIMKSGSVPVSDAPNSPEIKVPAIYISASYVAAGLLVAAQQPGFWMNRGFKNEKTFLKKNACIRIDLESNVVTRKLLTKFNRERSIEWNQDIVDYLTQPRFGFVFTGDQKYNFEDGKYFNNTYILNARTLGKNSNGEYQPIFAVLLRDFLNAYLNSLGLPLSEESLKNFFREVADWKNQQKDYNTDIINLMLRSGEDITQDGSTWSIKLKDGPKFINSNFDLVVE